jgi:hypothetical protein
LRPYTIYSPEYNLTSGGVRVLYGLRSWLEIKGQEVYMNEQKKGAIAVYPEIIHGNPLNGEKVVRYILQKPGLMTMGGKGGPTTFNEQAFVFSEMYNTIGADKDHIMFLPIINTELFKDKKQPRKGSCLFMRRKIGIPVKEFSNIPELTDELIKDQQALADYLNTVEVMHAYGPLSAMWDISRLSGCRVIIHPSEDKFKQTKEDIAKYELCQNFNGLSWEKDDGKKLDSDAFRKLYLDLRKQMNNKIDFFIKETQNDN